MKVTALLLTAAMCGVSAFAQESNPDAMARIRAQKERVQKILQAAENLQAAGMEREADNLRQQARHQMEEIEMMVRQAKEPGEKDQPNRPATDREPSPPAPGGGRALPPAERPRGDVAQLQAQIAELRATVGRLTERLERLEMATRPAQGNPPGRLPRQRVSGVLPSGVPQPGVPQPGVPQPGVPQPGVPQPGDGPQPGNPPPPGEKPE